MEQITNNVMLSQSFDLMKQRIRDLEIKLEVTRMKKGEFGKDGDPWDDPVLYELEREEKTLMRDISEAKSAFNEVEVMKCPEQTEYIALGHKVKVKLPDDIFAPDEGIDVTLVTQKDALLLAEKFGFDRDINLVISHETPLGRSLLGAKVGQTVRYSTGDELLRAKIVKIEISNLFLEQ